MSSKSTKLFIDCEWNSYKGGLISLALVSDTGAEFYRVVDYSDMVIDPWVAQHVIPALHFPTTSRYAFQTDLGAFLCQFPAIHVIADWPEDIAHFCDSLITGPGQRLDTPPLTFEVVRISSNSALPHNALADARGLRAAYLYPIEPIASLEYSND